MTDEQITNSRRGGAGTLVQVDAQTGPDGPYPVAIVRAPDGSLKALHFQTPGMMRAISEAEPKVGDRISQGPEGLRVWKADLYGEAGMTRPAAADWARWANIAFRRSPGGRDSLVAEKPAPPPAAPAPRIAREVKMPNGQLGITFDPPAPVSQGQVVPARDGRGLEIRR